MEDTYFRDSSSKVRMTIWNNIVNFYFYFYVLPISYHHYTLKVYIYTEEIKIKFIWRSDVLDRPKLIASILTYNKFIHDLSEYSHKLQHLNLCTLFWQIVHILWFPVFTKRLGCKLKTLFSYNETNTQREFWCRMTVLLNIHRVAYVY